MARRVWLHVGCPKTGTSFLQSVLWANKDVLGAQGLLLPRSLAHHWRASLYVRGAHRSRPHPWMFRLDWQDLVDTAHRAREDVLVTHELFAPAGPVQARAAIEALGGTETHVIVTARDLARQIPAGWQQSVKHGAVHRLDEFVHDVVHHGPGARNFWRMQDLPGLTSRWGRSLPPDRVHLVTVPPSGVDPAELWRRFASVLGIDAASVRLDGARRNDSLGRVEVELMRRVNESRRDLVPGTAKNHWFKDLLADEVLAGRAGKEKFALEPSLHPWVVDTARDTVATLRRRGYDVAGDLDDLVPPERPQGAGLAPTGDEELLAAAAETILTVLDRHRATVGRDERWRRVSSNLVRVLRWAARARPDLRTTSTRRPTAP
jgi:hypothetical protein